MKQLLTKQSRIIHRWLASCFTVLIFIWIGESIFLPSFFKEGMPAIVSDIPIQNSTISTTPLSFEQAKKAFMEQKPQGIQSFDEVDEIDYFPVLDIYRFKNTKRFFEWHFNARDGEIIKYGFDKNQFIAKQGYLEWLSPWLGRLIKGTLAILTRILGLTGFCLVLLPFFTKIHRKLSSLKITNSANGN
ncbi:MAG: PepSY domain-containing protein [Cyanobacteria bacterium SBLK]|nr:PepSY domain-containing protein [Cyanobacteria bacterium SBLK]